MPVLRALCSGNTMDQSAAANALISTAQSLARQLAPASPPPPMPTPPSSSFLNLPNINIPSSLASLLPGHEVCPQVALSWMPQWCLQHAHSRMFALSMYAEHEGQPTCAACASWLPIKACWGPIAQHLRRQCLACWLKAVVSFDDRALAA
jgi:hypothetical protein